MLKAESAPPFHDTVSLEDHQFHGLPNRLARHTINAPSKLATASHLLTTHLHHASDIAITFIIIVTEVGSCAEGASKACNVQSRAVWSASASGGASSSCATPSRARHASSSFRRASISRRTCSRGGSTPWSSPECWNEAATA